MKNFWIFLLIICSGFCYQPLRAQSDTSNLYQIYSSFSNTEKAEWTAFQNNWNYFEYSELKTKHHIKHLNCKNCESFYADIYIEINDKGAISISHCTLVKHCGISPTDKTIQTDFETSLKKQIFHSLKNKKFVARFGQVLKC